jgi:hypothetical protein
MGEQQTWMRNAGHHNENEPTINLRQNRTRHLESISVFIAKGITMNKDIPMAQACEETGIDQQALYKTVAYLNTRLDNTFGFGKTYVLSGKSCPMISMELHMIPMALNNVLKHVFREFRISMEISNHNEEKDHYYWIGLKLRWEHYGSGCGSYNLDFVLIYDVKNQTLTEKENTGL